MSNVYDAGAASAEEAADVRNLPAREEWFRTLGLGMFIHWGVDSQLGSVISHSLTGSSAEYADRFFSRLPASFAPREFEPDRWAELAALAGMRYVMFTTKHHSGFCMWPTSTTPFSVSSTPFNRDVVGEVTEAFRKVGIAVGYYFSPEDFWILHRQGRQIARKRDYAMPSNNEELRAHNQAQLRELFTNYGKIDLAFLDGFDNVHERDAIWAIDREVVITRGAMATPEQRTPEDGSNLVWEACYTLGTQWQFKPTNERYKSGGDLIEMLVEIRAKGGNFLLNVGPDPDGRIPFEQDRRIRELALWNFVNGEAVDDIRPLSRARDGEIWLTRSRDGRTVYAFLPNDEWPRGERREFLISSATANDGATIEILGHGGEVVEYMPEVAATPRLRQTDRGLELSVVRAQRLYNDHKWPNLVVAKLQGVQTQ